MSDQVRNYYANLLAGIRRGVDRLILTAMLERLGGRPFTRAELIRVTGLDDRMNREAIGRLRNAGAAIVSGRGKNSRGYRLAITGYEVRCFVDGMRARSLRQLRTARRVGRAFARYEQMALEG